MAKDNPDKVFPEVLSFGLLEVESPGVAPPNGVGRGTLGGGCAIAFAGT